MKPLFLITAAAVLALSGCNSEFTIKSGSERTLAKACESFELSASIHTSEGATAELILFRPDGYRILIGNGPIDGTLKTGSLPAPLRPQMLYNPSMSRLTPSSASSRRTSRSLTTMSTSRVA